MSLRLFPLPFPNRNARVSINRGHVTPPPPYRVLTPVTVHRPGSLWNATLGTPVDMVGTPRLWNVIVFLQSHATFSLLLSFSTHCPAAFPSSPSLPSPALFALPPYPFSTLLLPYPPPLLFNSVAEGVSILLSILTPKISPPSLHLKATTSSSSLNQPPPLTHTLNPHPFPLPPSPSLKPTSPSPPPFFNRSPP